MIPLQTLTMTLCLLMAEHYRTVTRIFAEVPKLVLKPEPIPTVLRVRAGRDVVPQPKWFARGFRRN